MIKIHRDDDIHPLQDSLRVCPGFSLGDADLMEISEDGDETL